jgi:hypothetical protein
MSVEAQTIVAALKQALPPDIVTELTSEYSHIKQQFFLRKFQPTELNGARFAECALRALEFLDKGRYTPFGQALATEKLIRGFENNVALSDSIRLFVPRLIRVILDVRNRRDVAHVGGEVDANYSDSLLVVHAVDWILTEFVRNYHSCSIDEARRLVSAINEVTLPVIDEIDGFVRVLDTELEVRDKVLVILYYKVPDKVTDAELLRWTEYKNITRFRRDLLGALHKEALVHYSDGTCILTTKGKLFVEKHLPAHLLSV